MSDSQKRRNEMAEKYAAEDWRMQPYRSPVECDHAFRDGWDARDRDLKEQLGLPEDANIEEVVKKLKGALEFYASDERYQAEEIVDGVEVLEINGDQGERAHEALKSFRGEK